MTRPALLALTSHGNAPYLMAARFTRALGDYSVVIPYYYGDAQAAILLEEIPQMAGRVFLSRELGDLFRPLLLESGDGLSYAQFGASLVDADNPSNVWRIENRLNAMLTDGIHAIPLDGSAGRLFSARDFAAGINSTLPVRVNLPYCFFFFTARMSDLYRSAPGNSDHRYGQEMIATLAPYANQWSAVEDTFAMGFIPRINALSYLAGKGEPGYVTTPPLAFTRPVSRKLQRPGILFVPSGTRTDLYKLHRIAEGVPREYDRLVLGSNGRNPDFPEDKFIYVRAEVYGDPNLVGVVSRGGWGTVWECQANLKPAALVSTDFLEDPEMGHSQFALNDQGLVQILDNSIVPFLADGRLDQLEAAMQKERAVDAATFGVHYSDGFAYMADRITTAFDLMV